PRYVICDHDAEDRATLERHLKWTTTAASKSISAGIQAVEARLRKAGDGRPRMFFMRGSLVESDLDLIDAAKPHCSEAEFDGYVWDLNNGRRKGESPVDRDNHGMDCCRYRCLTIDDRPIWSPSEISSGGASVFDDAPAGVFGMV